MTHLTSEQLSAHLDGALSGRAAEEAERHLAECEDCRNALAALAAQDDQLRPALTHDPGEAYFEELPAQIAERIQAHAGRDSRAGFNLFESPRSLAWIGTAAVIVVGASVVLMTSRQAETPGLRNRELMSRSERGQERAASPDEALPETRQVKPPPSPAAEGKLGTAKLRKDKSAGASMPPPVVAKKHLPAPDDRRARSPGQSAGQSPGPSNQRFAAPPPAQPPPSLAGRTQAALREPPKPAPATGRAAAPPPALKVAPKPLVAADRSATAPQVARTEQRPAATGRATEVRTNQAGEPVPVRRSVTPPVQAAKEKLDQVRKKVVAEPLQGNRLRDEGGSQGAAKTEPSVKALAPPSAPAPPAAQSPAPSATTAPSTMEEDALTGRDVRLCGEVRDDGGRPIAGAAVEMAAPRRGTVTDLHGEFCLEAPAGERRLTVMAVGFSSTTRTVRPTAEKLRITLAPVPVLTRPLEPVRPAAPSTRPSAPVVSTGDPFVTLPASQRSVVRTAQQIQANAEARPEAKAAARRYDDAADAWQRALRMLMGQPLELETRWHVAETRFLAWEHDPTLRRQSAALEALTSYAVRAPGGPERDRATRLLDRIRN